MHFTNLKMKKCVLILSLCLLFGCSQNSVNSNSLLNPPKWLYGSWEDERSQNGSFTQIQIEVSDNNVKIISGGGISVLDIVGMVRNANDAPNGSASIREEVKNEEEFEFIVIVNLENAEIQRTVYKFKNVDHNTITFYQNSVQIELYRI